MEKRHQQRLVGAIVIVALAVIFLPMLLRGPVERQALDLPMEIPPAPTAEDAAERDGDDDTPMLERIPVREPDDEQATPDEPSAMPDVLPGDDPDQMLDEAPTDSTPSDDAALVEPEPEPEPEREPEPEPEPESEPEPTVTEDDGFAVQVGSFRSRDNAMGLRDRLRDEGLPAFVVESSDADGEIYRLRVGPVATRGDADTLKQRVSDEAGIDSIVVRHR